MTYDPELVRQAGVRRAVRIRAVQAEGFTPRQAAFLVEVMVHAGVFLERHYAEFEIMRSVAGSRPSRASRSRRFPVAA